MGIGIGLARLFILVTGALMAVVGLLLIAAARASAGRSPGCTASSSARRSSWAPCWSGCATAPTRSTGRPTRSDRAAANRSTRPLDPRFTSTTRSSSTRPRDIGCASTWTRGPGSGGIERSPDADRDLRGNQGADAPMLSSPAGYFVPGRARIQESSRPMAAIRLVSTSRRGPPGRSSRRVRGGRPRVEVDFPYLNRELAWLEFNARVLFEAQGRAQSAPGAGEIPIDLRRQSRRVLPGPRRRSARSRREAGKAARSPDGRTAEEQLAASRSRVLELVGGTLRDLPGRRGVPWPRKASSCVEYAAIPEHHDGPAPALPR